jgi:anti-anti-sigma regulatory factor
MKCALNGELTITAGAKVRSELLLAIAGEGPFEIDTTGVNEVDAAGLQLLLAAMKSAASTRIPILFPPEARGAAVTAGLELLGLAARDWNLEDWTHG